MFRNLIYFTIIIGIISACSPDIITTDSGLKIQDIVVGKGAMPQKGDKLLCNAKGMLQDGTIFWESKDRPFSFKIGVGQVIKGWDEGLMTMREGGKRKLIIPPHLGYGARAKDKIPANSTLIFEIELLRITK